jgi:lysophospholipase L1-like esterase
MFGIFRSIVVATLLIGFFETPQLAMAQNMPITIMPMGDSITAGTDYYTNTASGYRDPLYRDLIASGISNFSFVGNNGSYGNTRTLVQANEYANNGFGGDWIIDLYNGLISSAAPTDGGSGPAGGYWLNNIQPTFILLQAGTNDVLHSESLSTMETNLNQLIAEIHTKSPQTIVFVAAIPPFSIATSYNSAIQQYNSYIQNTLVPANSFTRFVDNNTPFYSGGTVNPLLLGNDNNVGIHPTRYGYPIIAADWAAAIRSYLAVNPTLYTVSVTNGTINNGGSSGSFPAGTVLTINSNPPSGNQFGGWTGSTAQATLALNNPFSPITTYVVPGANTTITANYAATGTPLIPNGTYAIFGSSDSYQSNYSLGPNGTTVAASAATNGSSVLGQTYTGATTQQWVLKNLQTSNGNNQVELSVPGTSNTIAMGVAGSTAAGSNLDVETYSSSSSQQWVPSQVLGAVELVNVNSVLAVNDYNSAFGNPMDQGSTGDLSGYNPLATTGYLADQYFTLYPVTGTAPPAAPTGLTATPGSGQVALSWNTTSGATSYNVYRGTTTNGIVNMAILATNVTTTSYTDKALTGPPPVPLNLTATGGSGQVALTWAPGTTTTYYYEVVAVNSNGTSGGSNDANAAPTAGPAITGYNIYRSTGAYQEGSTPYATSSTASFSDTNVTSGTTYYYVVAATGVTGTSPTGNQAMATPSGGGSAPAITSSTTASGTVGTAFSYQITATNSPTSYSATGLPGGLSVNTSTGAITGTPTGSGTSSVTIGATNAGGTGTATLTLTISAASNPPVITSSTSASGTVGTAFSYQIAATNNPTSYSATGLPGGLSVNTSTGAITGTPTASGTSSVTIGATNASGTGTATLSVTISAASNPPVITSSTSVGGTVGTAFSYQITATNSPTSYSATGLPSGLSVSTSTGAITGTPTSSGTSSVTIGATNASGTGTATLSVTISAAGTQNSIAVQFVGLGTAMLSTDSAGVPAVAQTNWQPLTGSSFSGIALTNNNGAATTATLSGSADGTYFCASSFTAGTGNAKLCSGELFDGNINTETNSITISAIPYAQYDVYIYGESDAGTRGATFTVAPAGGSASSLSFQTESNGSAWTAGTSTWNGSGTPPTLAVGNYVHFVGLTASSFTLKFGGINNVSMEGIQIVNTSTGGSPPAITSSTSASGTAGTAFSYQIAATNSPTSYSASGLPGGLSVNTSTGAITGTPTASGTSSVTVGATNASGTGTATLTLTIAAASNPPVITSSTSASGTVGAAFSYQITATNSPTSYSASGLPGGLSVNTSTGAITGTPTTSGTSSVTIGATNASGTGPATLTLTISAAGAQSSIAVQFVGSGTAMLSTDSAGVPAVAQANWKPLTGSSFSNVALTDNNGAATTASLSGSADGTYFCLSNFATGTGNAKLCSGELFDGNINTETNSITISGIPYGQYDIYIYGESDAGTRGATFTVTPAGGSASSLSFQTESNGSAWTAGTSTWNGSGTPPTLAVGNYVHFTGLTANSFTLKFGGINNVSMEGIQIVKTSTGGSPPAITSSTSASGTAGTAFSYQITATNSPSSYSATGLPSGLSVNTSNGAITGTPTASGTSSVTIGATNASGTGTATLTLTISAASTPPVITSSTSASGTVGSAFSYQITATNSPTSYSASGLPGGLSVNTSTGAITGAPTASGTSSVTIGATNASGTGTATLSLTISAGGTQSSIAIQFQGQGTALLSTDSAGLAAVAQTNWNVLPGASFSGSTLVNSSGTATTMTLTGSANGGYWSGGSSAPPAGNAKLASGELYNSWPGSPTLTVSNIPYAKYDVYVYAGIDAPGRNETVSLTPSGGSAQFYSFTTEAGGSAWTLATSTWNGSGTAPSLPSANYVHYSGLTASSFTMAWGAPGNGGLNGIQIVPVQ